MLEVSPAFLHLEQGPWWGSGQAKGPSHPSILAPSPLCGQGGALVKAV